MTIKLFCKHCKDTIEPKRIYEIVSCRCAKTSVKQLIGKSVAIKGDNYALVDDQGNELVAEDIIEPQDVEGEEYASSAHIPGDKECIEALMMNLDHQVTALESLSSAGRYAPATNQDLLTVLTWIQSACKMALRILEAKARA